MSLINEALKKAQRQRAQEEADAASPAPAGGKAVRRNPPRTAEATLLISAGAVVLVVLSVVLTVFLLNRKQPEPQPANAAKSAPAAPAADTSSSAPVVVARIADRPSTAAGGDSTSPVTTPPEPAPTSPGAAPASSATPPANAPVTGAANAPAPLPAEAIAPAVTETPAPRSANPDGGSTRAAATTTYAEPARETAAPAPKTPPKPDERAHAFLDTLRVTGIRASGNDSRVLMNERVYRVNDIVERNLGLRLTKVGTDSLMFEDANGATYVKYF